MPTFLATSAPLFEQEMKLTRDTERIKFQVRQPSFSLLAGELISKSGSKIDCLHVDDSTSDESDVPLDLSMSKSSELLLEDFMNLDETRFNNMVSTEPMFGIGADFKDSDHLTINVLKYLTNNNAEKWRQIGYVPPRNVLNT